jgi:hypothetical protein
MDDEAKSISLVYYTYLNIMTIEALFILLIFVVLLVLFLKNKKEPNPRGFKEDSKTTVEETEISSHQQDIELIRSAPKLHKNALLNPGEKKVFFEILASLSKLKAGLYCYPQVCVGEFIVYSENIKHLIGGNRVDMLLTDRNMNPVCIVEVYGARARGSSNNENVQKRDEIIKQICRSAGINYVSFSKDDIRSSEQIKRKVELMLQGLTEATV